jgi:hypothetical protein
MKNRASPRRGGPRSCFYASVVIKEKCSLDSGCRRLEELLVEDALTARQRHLIRDEISNLRAGERGEREAAYFIDFELRDSKNYAVLHDLRIEHEGRVAQIDHLIIGRMANAILIESKNISTALRTNGRGEFEVKTRFGWKGMASPVEQNKRHVAVLREFLKASEIVPKRIGFQLMPEFYHWVLVPADCTFAKSCARTDIVKMDMFRARFEEWINRKDPNEVIKMAKVISPETLRDFATRLASYHAPINVDYRRKFGIASPASVSRRRTIIPSGSKPIEDASTSPNTQEGEICARCSEPVARRVAQFCLDNGGKFHGEVLCRACQRLAAKRCDDCDAEVDAKVVAFCRFNGKRLGKRVLCRKCQRNVSTLSISELTMS